MRVDVTEHWPTGPATFRPGVEIDVAVPEATLRATARAMLAETAEARVPALGDRPKLTLRLTRQAAGFGIRLRVKPGTERPRRPTAEDTARRMAAIMVERAGPEGADGDCRWSDFGHAGISFRRALRLADRARDLVFDRAAAPSSAITP